ncbi:MAG: LysE family translocator [Sneathiella sp.]
MDWLTLSSFSLVTALLVMSPGPNGLLITKTVPTSGRSAGFANIGGFMIAFFLHGALSIFGISVILVQSAHLFMAVKIAGALYLIWIGIRALRDAFAKGAAVPDVKPAKRTRTLSVAFGEGFLTNALNPKVSLFYLAAFPQFIPISGNVVEASFLLVFVHAVICAAWFSFMVLLLSRVTAVAGGDRFQRWLKGVTGAVFIGFGVKLMTLRS